MSEDGLLLPRGNRFRRCHWGLSDARREPEDSSCHFLVDAMAGVWGTARGADHHGPCTLGSGFLGGIRHRVCMAGWGKGRGHGHPEHTLTGMGDNMRGAGPHNGVGGRAYPSIANGNQTRDALRSAGSRNDPARRGRVTETLCTRSYKKETAATPEVQPSAPSEKSS